jgi:hypothetical protein
MNSDARFWEAHAPRVSANWTDSSCGELVAAPSPKPPKSVARGAHRGTRGASAILRKCRSNHAS